MAANKAKMLGESGIDLVCYNFMAVFDWTRTNLTKPRSDGSTVMSYEQEVIDKIDPAGMFAHMDGKSDSFSPSPEP